MSAQESAQTAESDDTTEARRAHIDAAVEAMRQRDLLAERERIARAIEALPVRRCHEDPTGVVLVSVSRSAVLDLVLPPGQTASDGSA